jgi:hypothetical protein
MPGHSTRAGLLGTGAMLPSSHAPPRAPPVADDPEHGAGPNLAAFMRPARPTFAVLGGARLGKSAANAPMLQEKTEISLSRALLVPEGVPRAPSL